MNKILHQSVVGIIEITIQGGLVKFRTLLHVLTLVPFYL